VCVLRERHHHRQKCKLVRGVGIPTHGPASARSEVSIAVLVLAKHLRTGLERAIRGEGGLALAGMAKKASGGRLSSSVWRQAAEHWVV